MCNVKTILYFSYHRLLQFWSFFAIGNRINLSKKPKHVYFPSNPSRNTSNYVLDETSCFFIWAANRSWKFTQTLREYLYSNNISDNENAESPNKKYYWCHYRSLQKLTRQTFRDKSELIRITAKELNNFVWITCWFEETINSIN